METEDTFKKIPGLNMSGLILLAARPGMGKTSFALNMARTVAEEKTAAVFSMEMSREQVSARLLVCAPSAENGRTHAGNIYIDDTPTLSMSDIYAKCFQLDNLGLLVTVTGAQNGAAPAGSITLTSDGLNETLTLQNGKTTHKWENLSDKEYTVTAAYSGDTNYKAANSKLTFDAAKKNQESFAISPVEAKTYAGRSYDSRNWEKREKR